MSELDGILGIIFELYSTLAFGEALICSKCIGDPLISLLFKTPGITLNRRTLWIGLALNIDPSVTANAINPHLSIARRLWTRFARMAKCLTLVPTLFP